jgi:hypothetical protein
VENHSHPQPTSHHPSGVSFHVCILELDEIVAIKDARGKKKTSQKPHAQKDGSQ